MGIKEWLRRAARASRGQFSETEEPAREKIDGAEDAINEETGGMPSGEADTTRESDRGPTEDRGTNG